MPRRLLAAILLMGSTAASAGDLTKPRSIRLSDGSTRTTKAAAKGATALVFCSAECPISNGYSPTLNALRGEFPADKVAIVGVFIDPDISDDALKTHAAEYQLSFPVTSDRSGKLARDLGVKVTPEVVVLDENDKVRYRGRIDDQYAARGKLNANPTSHELKDAIAAILSGNEVTKPQVEAVGCPLPEPPKAATPTYFGEVAPILREKCEGCHRPGQVGPFALQTYAQAKKRAADLANVTEERSMPPWKPSPGYGGPFKNDHSLTDDQIKTIAAWAEAGAPEGDASKKLPPIQLPTDPNGWTLGTPDMIVEMPQAFEIPAKGEDIYRCFVIPTTLPKDVYVSAVEYKPGNRAVVHHVITYVDIKGQARKLDQADPGEGYTCFSGPMFEIHGDLGGWVPGNEPSFLPEGIGRSLPKGADVVMQMHYHPSGKPETDRSKIGLYFCKKPVKQVLHWSAAANMAMILPKDNAKIEIPARWKVPIDMDAYAVSPHMHLLGKDMTMVLTEPDGKQRPLIRIDDWDFQWQNTYYFKEPIRIKKGTYLDVVAHYDNSSKNPRNPNSPPKDVKWGEATTDEMCIGFMAVTKAGQDLTQTGQIDDLGVILEQSYQDQRREYEARMKEAQKKK